MSINLGMRHDRLLRKQAAQMFEIGAQLERDDAEDDVEDAQGRDADQALRAEGEEVLEQVLATRQAGADDDSHVGEGDREVLLGHRVLPIANVSRGRGPVPR